MADIAEWNDFHGKKTGNTIIQFYEREVQNAKKTLEAGRPIFEMKVYVRKITPGDTSLEIDRPIRPEDKTDYPVQWAAFEAKQTQKVDGTPLEEWPLLTRSQIAELRALNILTVEHVATMNDTVAHRVMGFHGMRQKAQEWLKNADKNSLRDELKAKDEEIARQAEMLAEMAKRLDAIEAKRGPGRPAKE